jgi:hypothetical protein
LGTQIANASCYFEATRFWRPAMQGVSLLYFRGNPDPLPYGFVFHGKSAEVDQLLEALQSLHQQSNWHLMSTIFW